MLGVALALKGELNVLPAIGESKTTLFSSVNAGFAYHIESRLLNTMDPPCSPDFHISHRLIHFSMDSAGAATFLLHHDLDLSTNKLLEHLHAMHLKRALAQAKVDAITEDVLRSTTLSHAQKSTMVEDIKGWPILSK
jgi:hypothetical protein